MLLKHTISQLDTGPMPRERAEEMGRLGYLQWLACLPGGSNYRLEAMRACRMAEPHNAASPALSVFCELITASLRMPLVPLSLTLPARQRRGGARARRLERSFP